MDTSNHIKTGSWVEVYKIILQPQERTAKIPKDTKNTPFEMKARGFLLNDADMGDQVEIRTLTGRILSGKLITVNPGYRHSFGAPIQELLNVGNELKKIIEEH